MNIILIVAAVFFALAPGAVGKDYVQLPAPDPVTPEAAHQLACRNTVDLTKRLLEKYGETAQHFFMETPTSVVQIFANPDSENATATIILSRSDGTSCIVTAGYFYTAAPQGDPL